MNETLAIGQKLVDLCRQGKNMEAVNSLYSPDIVSVEAMAGPGGSNKVEGLEAIKGKAEWWEANHEVHSAQAEGPYPNGDRFVVHFKYDVTVKGGGPMSGKRMTLDEAALYTVKNGKITHEEFFYQMGG